MKSKEQRSVLKKKAFAQPAMLLAEGGLVELQARVYQGQKPNYDFCLQDRSPNSPFHRQFVQLINFIKKECEAVFAPQEQQLYQSNLNVFHKRFLERDHPHQPDSFYIEIKKLMEKICQALLRIQDQAEKISILKDLCLNVANCSSGVFQHLLDTENRLNNDNTITTWLSQFRKTIIDQLAEEHIQRMQIMPGNSIHVNNVFYMYANDQGWNVYGHASLRQMKEIFSSLAQIDTETLVAFHHEFLRRYNPVEIVIEITNRLYAHLADCLKAAGPMPVIRTQAELNKLFRQLPLLHDDTMFYQLFAPADAASLDPFCLKAVEYDGEELVYRLKSVAELKSVIVSYLVEYEVFACVSYAEEDNSAPSIFKLLCFRGYPEINLLIIKKAATQEDLRFFIRDHALELDCINCSSLAFYQDSQVPMLYSRFKLFYDSGVRDFKECVLHFNDWSLLPLDIDLTKATLVNPEFSASRWLSVLSSRQVRLMGDVIVQVVEGVEPVSALIEAAINQNKPGLLSSVYDAYPFFWQTFSLLCADLQHAMQHNQWRCFCVSARRLPEAGTNNSLISLLFQAVHARQVEAVSILLSKHVRAYMLEDLTYRDHSALLMAVSYGNTEMVQAILNGSQESAPWFVPAILRAVQYGYWSCVLPVLLKMTVEDTLFFRNLLADAITANAVTVTEYLFSQRVFFNPWFNSSQYDPLFVQTATVGRLAMLRVLLRSGTDFSYFYSAAAKEAARNQHWACVEELLKVMKIQNTQCFRYLLACAAVANQTPIVLTLLAKQVSPSLSHYVESLRDYLTPLRAAAYHGNVALLKALLKPNSNLSAKFSKYAVIELAALNQQWQAVEFIIDHTPIIKKDYRFERALLRAAQFDQQVLVHKLITRGVSLHYADPLHKYTALHYAAEQGNVTMVNYLLRQGADPGAKVILRPSVYHRLFNALQMTGLSKSGRLSDKQLSCLTPIQLAATNHHWDCVVKIAEHRPEIKANAFHYGSALLRAARAGQVEVVATLLKAVQPEVLTAWRCDETGLLLAELIDALPVTRPSRALGIEMRLFQRARLIYTVAEFSDADDTLDTATSSVDQHSL